MVHMHRVEFKTSGLQVTRKCAIRLNLLFCSSSSDSSHSESVCKGAPGSDTYGFFFFRLLLNNISRIECSGLAPAVQLVLPHFAPKTLHFIHMISGSWAGPIQAQFCLERPILLGKHSGAQSSNSGIITSNKMA